MIKRFLFLGIFTAVISSAVVYGYMYSMYSFIPEGSPDPLVGLDSPMRKELTVEKAMGLYVFLSLVFSMLLWLLNKYLNKWGVFSLNVLVGFLSMIGFLYILGYQKEGWDMFIVVGPPLLFIWPLVWMGCQPLFLMEGNKRGK